MNKDFTKKIILNYYGELDVIEQIELIEQVEVDKNAQYAEKNLNLIFGELDKVGVDPHPTSIKIIMENSQKNSLETSF